MRQFAGDGLAVADMVLVHAEEAHHETGSTEPALRAVALDHRLLCGMERDGLLCSGRCVAHGLDQRIFRQVFHRPQRHAVHRMGQADAAVHGAVVQLAVAFFAQHHGAGAAVAFATAFLGAGVAQVFAQHLQQGAVGWYIAQRHGLASAQELQGSCCHDKRHFDLGWKGSAEGRTQYRYRHMRKLMAPMPTPL